MHDKGFPSSNRVAVITGGTTGIGGATARELALRSYNLLLVSLDDPNDLAEELRKSGSSVHFLRLDLASSESSAKIIIEKAIEYFDRIDLLVNCAGVISHKDIADVSGSDWDRIFSINLKSPFFLIQQALPYLIQSQGNVINVSSTNAINPAKKNQLYDSLKAALNNLTMGLSLDFRDSGVRVNAVMPGGVRTPLVSQWLREHLNREPVQDDFNNPGLAEPEQIARVIAVLASDDMSWVNGVTLPVDGGYSLG